MLAEGEGDRAAREGSIDQERYPPVTAVDIVEGEETYRLEGAPPFEG